MLGLDDIIKKIFGSRSARELKKMKPLVDRINGLEARMQGLSDAELKALTPDFKQRLENGAPIDDLLPEAFAVVREVGRRTMEMRHFDVQLLGGIVLHRGSVAEMKTGEGKTLVATLPVYLNALVGKGVHVVTVNDYLASRDAEWMGTIYSFLGLSVGTILSSDRDQAAKQRAYGADITYGTNNEFGFDYLRDNMKFAAEEYVQRGHHYAIVDEVDSILIDEARTPLIISGPASQDVDRYYIVDGVVPLLQADIDYVVDEKSRSVSLTDAGVDRVEDKLGVDNLYDSHNMEILHHVSQALKAHTIFKRDRDYVVQQGKVIIVDEHTGRLMHGRRWSDGLHQAVEAKEKLRVEPESQTYATITFQNYFRMYSKLSGMTGTAETEAEEFRKIYNLDCLVVPTNRGVIRNDQHDIVYKTQSEKFRAVMAELHEVHAKGQPVLVGTTSVEKSELVSRLLRHEGIPHEVLNARNHAREAEIVAQAGRKGAITISTNMAGRGTDIKLGGDPEAMARHEVDPHVDPEGFRAAVARHRAQCEVEKQEVLALGGLHILGTERHESRRIDNQLRGRSGRQGDPGSSRFYLSLEDDLLRVFGSEKIIGWMEKMGLKDDEPIEHRWITKSIENAQVKVEGHNFNARKNLLEYDDVMNLQRKSIYEMRRKALEGDGVREMVVGAIEHLVEDVMDECLPEGTHPEAWEITKLRKRLDEIFDLRWTETDDELRDFAVAELRERMRAEAVERYEAKEREVGAASMRQVERMLLLQLTDQHWKDHLLAMDRLRTGIGLRGYGQKNPLLEYKREGTSMFLLMNSLRDEAVVARLLRLDLGEEGLTASPGKNTARMLVEGELGAPAPPPPPPKAAAPAEEGPGRPIMTLQQMQAAVRAAQEAQARQAAAQAAAQAATQAAARPAAGAEAREWGLERGIKRNDPCPCGSGLKFKKCCYKSGAAEDEAPVAPSSDESTEAAPQVAADDGSVEQDAAAAPAIEPSADGEDPSPRA
ncbi:preprotein translocase subunit SecA [Myxococcota bacterium]|nr:preprotein translocase subunit SecA [Myxococcota bacterium]